MSPPVSDRCCRQRAICFMLRRATDVTDYFRRRVIATHALRLLRERRHALMVERVIRYVESKYAAARVRAPSRCHAARYIRVCRSAARYARAAGDEARHEDMRRAAVVQPCAVWFLRRLACVAAPRKRDICVGAALSRVERCCRYAVLCCCYAR